MKVLRLTRTRAALVLYDRTVDAFHEKLTEASTDEAVAMVEAIDQAAVVVGEAFADDTSDRNPADVAKYVRPNSWLRGLVIACESA